MLAAINNPFISLSAAVPQSKMFATGPEDIEGSWLEGNRRFMRGIDRLGEVLNGGR